MLIDTNVFLEGLLEQEKAERARFLFSTNNLSKLYISDFSIGSIGILLNKKKKEYLFNMFIEDILFRDINIIRLNPENLKVLVSIIEKFNLDFDDAYQYTAAKLYNLEIVSYDKDFDKTDLKRIEP